MVVRLVLFDRETVDVNAKTLKGMLGKYIVEDLKSPVTGKVLFPCAYRDYARCDRCDSGSQKVKQVVSNVVREVKEQKDIFGRNAGDES